MKAVQQRKGDWMQTASGRQFWPLDPHPDDVAIEDIAHALSNMCRYGGHSKVFYSVAEHSVLVSHQVPIEHALTALLHDATEAYCVDVPRPLKRFLTNYEDIEQGLWLAIAERFGLPAEMPECVKVADNAVLLAEKPVLIGTQYVWNIPGTPADVDIVGLDPWLARGRFMQRYQELTQ